MSNFTTKLLHYIKDSKWTILTLGISVVMIGTIGRNAWHGVIITRQMVDLEAERSWYQEEIKRDSTLIETLKDDDALERYARENYYMRSKGEDLYILK